MNFNLICFWFLSSIAILALNNAFLCVINSALEQKHFIVSKTAIHFNILIFLSGDEFMMDKAGDLLSLDSWVDNGIAAFGKTGNTLT